MAEVQIKGLDELLKFMDQLPPKIEANVARGALRAGMNVVKPVAQRNIHSVSGELAKGLMVGTRRRGSKVTSNLKATGKHRSVAHLVEFGTRPHNIAAKFRGWLSFMNIFRKEVHHPGARPKPFLRPALDSQAQSAVRAVAEYTKHRLATKHGLDTAHIKVEGDE
jgi:HK97 gp10 family phage protein